jgi:hypothetical protein
MKAATRRASWFVALYFASIAAIALLTLVVKAALWFVI